mmetsp:Transcript_71364/g.159784  ORF Transcript_71364/g.159784 Transcript_71364/m.159784 type:complete len:250 (-) Transcript_71364:221-970(-)
MRRVVDDGIEDVVDKAATAVSPRRQHRECPRLLVQLHAQQRLLGVVSLRGLVRLQLVRIQVDGDVEPHGATPLGDLAHTGVLHVRVVGLRLQLTDDAAPQLLERGVLVQGLGDCALHAWDHLRLHVGCNCDIALEDTLQDTGCASRHERSRSSLLKANRLPQHLHSQWVLEDRGGANANKSLQHLIPVLLEYLALALVQVVVNPHSYVVIDPHLVLVVELVDSEHVVGHILHLAVFEVWLLREVGPQPC